MKIALFYHSLISDWNHGNAHFLRGVATELIEVGHDVRIYEPRDAWSVVNLVKAHGETSLTDYRQQYPKLTSVRYDLASLSYEKALEDVDLVLVHEWNDHELVAEIGRQRRRLNNFVLLFHDTHHRSVTDPESMSKYDLTCYDGVLAFGNVIRDIYLKRKWSTRVWTWHEAADTRVFYPRASSTKTGDIVWIGNWGDDERKEELKEFLLTPIQELNLNADVYGVRYPPEALQALEAAGITYHGWLPNYKAPEVFAQFAATVHVPRRPYVRSLPGIPTIRPFEAMACGIPLVSAPWNDAEHLFTPGEDFVMVNDGSQMRDTLRELLGDPGKAAAIAAKGLSTILARHTCKHRMHELMEIYKDVTGAHVQNQPSEALLAG